MMAAMIDCANDALYGVLYVLYRLT
jgi:hypothetical protein